jgi:hypothetical protein
LPESSQTLSVIPTDSHALANSQPEQSPKTPKEIETDSKGEAQSQTTRDQRTYSPNEKEAAYTLWKSGNYSSLIELANYLGYPVRTVYQWADDLKWREKREAELSSIREAEEQSKRMEANKKKEAGVSEPSIGNLDIINRFSDLTKNNVRVIAAKAQKALGRLDRDGAASTKEAKEALVACKELLALCARLDGEPDKVMKVQVEQISQHNVNVVLVTVSDLLMEMELQGFLTVEGREWARGRLLGTIKGLIDGGKLVKDFEMLEKEIPSKGF